VASTLSDLRFDNRFTADLPADPVSSVQSRQVAGAGYSRVTPHQPGNPSLLATSAEMVHELGLLPDTVASDDFLLAVSGGVLPADADPYAACYGGHQFGNWAGQLGDGRAITLGEIVTGAGHRHTLQLKGAGPTPYSRGADGLAVLRSSVREFLCSEAMHHLGVPTTRALSLALTGDPVMRDMFYDGNPEWEPGAVVCRVAPSFIRFGNFEIFASRGDHTNLRTLADHAITLHFPELVDGRHQLTADDYVSWFTEVARRTATMIVEWQRVGFVHGVMNTDNMSIHGLTIDYGPYGWLEDYDPGWTPNTTDRQFKRYRYSAQPHIGQWNLTQLANAIYPLVGAAEGLQAGLETYVSTFNEQWASMMAAKLGLVGADTEAVSGLVQRLLEILPRTETDMTLFFRELGSVETAEAVEPEQRLAPLLDAYYRPDELTGDLRAETLAWLDDYAACARRHQLNDQQRHEAMSRVNPRVVLRNYLAQVAIDRASDGDPSGIHELLEVLRHPYDDQPGCERFAEKRPEWARSRPGCSMLSCSS
jgi:uncharacterized protein YdiU (UPF0061 family)